MKRAAKIFVYLAIIVGFLTIANIYTEHAIDKCMKAGHDRSYCERGVN